MAKHAFSSQAGEVAKRLKPRLPAPPMAGTGLSHVLCQWKSLRTLCIFVFYNFTIPLASWSCRSFDRRGTESHASRPQIRLHFLENECEELQFFFVSEFAVASQPFLRVEERTAVRLPELAPQRFQKRIVESFQNLKTDVFSTWNFREACGLFLHWHLGGDRGRLQIAKSPPMNLWLDRSEQTSSALQAESFWANVSWRHLCILPKFFSLEKCLNWVFSSLFIQAMSLWSSASTKGAASETSRDIISHVKGSGFTRAPQKIRLLRPRTTQTHIHI